MCNTQRRRWDCRSWGPEVFAADVCGAAFLGEDVVPRLSTFDLTALVASLVTIGIADACTAYNSPKSLKLRPVL